MCLLRLEIQNREELERYFLRRGGSIRQYLTAKTLAKAVVSPGPPSSKKKHQPQFHVPDKK